MIYLCSVPQSNLYSMLVLRLSPCAPVLITYRALRHRATPGLPPLLQSLTTLVPMNVSNLWFPVTCCKVQALLPLELYVCIQVAWFGFLETFLCVSLYTIQHVSYRSLSISLLSVESCSGLVWSQAINLNYCRGRSRFRKVGRWSPCGDIGDIPCCGLYLFLNCLYLNG